MEWSPTGRHVTSAKKHCALQLRNTLSSQLMFGFEEALENQRLSAAA